MVLPSLNPSGGRPPLLPPSPLAASPLTFIGQNIIAMSTFQVIPLQKIWLFPAINDLKQPVRTKGWWGSIFKTTPTKLNYLSEGLHPLQPPCYPREVCPSWTPPGLTFTRQEVERHAKMRTFFLKFSLCSQTASQTLELTVTSSIPICHFFTTEPVPAKKHLTSALNRLFISNRHVSLSNFFNFKNFFCLTFVNALHSGIPPP